MSLRKNTRLVSLLLTLTFVLGACGGNEDEDATKDVTNNDTSNDITDGNPGEDPKDAPGQNYGFKRFELVVHSNDPEDTLEILYEEKKDATDVEYMKESSNQNILGSDAMDLLRPFLEALSIDEETSDDEVIAEIIDSFQLENYDTIEASITYLNNDTKQYSMTRE